MHGKVQHYLNEQVRRAEALGPHCVVVGRDQVSGNWEEVRKARIAAVAVAAAAA